MSTGTVAKAVVPLLAVAERGGVLGQWAAQHLPETLLAAGPLGVPVWQWLALVPLGGVAWAVGAVAGRVTRALLLRMAVRTAARWDDALVARMGGPLALAWTTAAAAALVPLLDPGPAGEAVVSRLIRSGGLIALFWATLRGVDVAVAAVERSPWASERPGSRSLLAIAGRVAKVAVGALAAVAALSELGYPVASLVAGLGLGGLAFALAAQKTVENLFGALAIGFDQPIREGDFIRVDELVGTVEAIGLRATRIRTLDRTLVSIPNGRLAEMRLESFTARDRIRLACDLGLVYGTTARQMQEILAGLERALRAHPLIWPDAVVVRLKGFGAHSLDVEVMAWFRTTDWSEFQLIRQEILLQFMEVVQAAGSDLAFPTRTIHVAARRPAPRTTEAPRGGREHARPA